MSYFLSHGSTEHALRKDEALNHLHWATTRRDRDPAADGARHRSSPAARGDARRDARKAHRVQAPRRQGGGPRGARPARLRHAARRPLWPRRAVRRRPAGQSVDRQADRTARHAARFGSNSTRTSAAGSSTGRWTIASRCCASTIPTIPSRSRREQIDKLRQAYDAARKVGRELLIEIIASKNGPHRRRPPCRACWPSSMPPG